MEKITVCVFTCDAYQDLWDHCVRLLKENFPMNDVSEILLITDKPTSRSFEGVRIVLSNDNNDFVKRFASAAGECKTKYFLYTLDDYFYTQKINQSKFEEWLGFIDKNNADYLKLYTRSKKIVNKKITTGVKTIKAADPTIGYALDFYPGLWSTAFVKNLCDKWPLPERDIWHFEGKNCETETVKNAKAFFYTGRDFPFLDVIRKGKLIRKANRVLKKQYGIDLLTSRKLRTIHETVSYNLSVFVSDHMNPKFKAWLKKILKKQGKTFYSDR